MNIAINPKGWLPGKTANGTHHLNWGVKAGNTVYVAGMLALDPFDGSLIGAGDVAAQTRRVLDSIAEVLKAAGGSMADVTMNQIFLRDMDDYHKMNAVYVEYFEAFLPARFCLKAEMVRPDFLVEIVTTAVLSS